MSNILLNNYKTTLVNPIGAADTQIYVGNSLPALGAGDYYLLTLFARSGAQEYNWEIVKVTAAGGTTLTVTRGQEGTTARDWVADTLVEMRLTAGQVSSKTDLGHTHTLSQITDFPTAVSATELGYLDGVTSSIQTQINSKQPTITGAATTITTSNLTASMAMVTDANGKATAHGTVSATELGYLDGVTSAIQTQLNGKAATTHTHAISDVTGLQTALDTKATIDDATTSTTKTWSSSKIDAGLASVGSSFTVTEETLTADRTLTEADAGTWLFETTANRLVFLPAAPTKDVEFNIVYVGTTTNVYLEIKCTGDTSYFTRLYSGAAARIAFDSVTGKWTLYGSGYKATRTGNNAYSIDISVSGGYSANGSSYGTAVGRSANGSNNGAAVGRSANGSNYGASVGYATYGLNYGVAVGYVANGSSYGAAVGYATYGLNYGVAVGYVANGSNDGVAVGRSANATKRYGSAIGVYSKQERYGGHARSGDHLSTSKLHIEEVHWKGITTDATATELFLHGVSGNRCILLASSVLGFTVRVTGIASTTFEVIDLELKGTIKRDASNVTSLVGTVSSTVINNELSGATAVLTADDTNEALKLTVTGLAGKTINWGAVGLLLDRRI